MGIAGSATHCRGMPHSQFFDSLVSSTSVLQIAGRAPWGKRSPELCSVSRQHVQSTSVVEHRFSIRPAAAYPVLNGAKAHGLSHTNADPDGTMSIQSLQFGRLLRKASVSSVDAALTCPIFPFPRFYVGGMFPRSVSARTNGEWIIDVGKTFLRASLRQADKIFCPTTG